MLLAGRNDHAYRFLGYIERTYMRPNGDFVLADSVKSENGVFNEYWPYMNAWIAMASQKMGRFDMAHKAWAYVRTYYHEGLGTFTLRSPYGEGGQPGRGLHHGAPEPRVALLRRGQPGTEVGRLPAPPAGAPARPLPGPLPAGRRRRRARHRPAAGSRGPRRRQDGGALSALLPGRLPDLRLAAGAVRGAWLTLGAPVSLTYRDKKILQPLAGGFGQVL